MAANVSSIWPFFSILISSLRPIKTKWRSPYWCSAWCRWTYLSYFLRASSGWQIRSWQKVDTSNFMGAPFQVTFHFESTVAPSGWQDLLWDSTLLKKSQLRIFVVSHCSQRYKLPFRKSCQYDILIDLKCQFLIFGKVPLNQKGHGQRPKSPIFLNRAKIWIDQMNKSFLILWKILNEPTRDLFLLVTSIFWNLSSIHTFWILILILFKYFLNPTHYWPFFLKSYFVTTKFPKRYI